MRRYQNCLLAMAGAVLFACLPFGENTAYGGESAPVKAEKGLAEESVSAGNGAAETAEKGPGISLNYEKKELEKEEQELMGRIAAAEEADSLILVVGQGGSDVSLSYHTKDEGGAWREEFETKGRYGKNGASADKREGDKKTPIGTYRFTMAFGVKDDPGSVLPYHKLTDTDYWVDDPASAHYNQLVDLKAAAKDWNSAEHMAAAVPFYNYGLALDYNRECVPGKGSAIFLHCMNGEADTGTSGCVKVPEEYVKMLVQSVDSETRIVIVSDIGQLDQK